MEFFHIREHILRKAQIKWHIIVINQIDKIENGDLAIIVDCGEDDFFLNVNKDLHNRLLERKIDHDFITRPGGHTGQYWNNSIDYQILFFDKFFKK